MSTGKKPLTFRVPKGWGVGLEYKLQSMGYDSRIVEAKGTGLYDRVRIVGASWLSDNEHATIAGWIEGVEYVVEWYQEQLRDVQNIFEAMAPSPAQKEKQQN